MKVLIKEYCLICIFLHGLFSQTSLAQSRSTSLMATAEAATNTQDYGSALLQFEKAFFFGNSEEKNTALEAKALVLQNLEQYDDALETFARIKQRKLSEEKRFSIRYQMILSAYLSGQFGEAKSNLLIASQAFTSESQVKDLLFMKILVANAMMDWDTGK